MNPDQPAPTWVKPPLLPIRWGKRRPLSRPRRIICDLMQFAKQVPSIPVQKRMRLPRLVLARRSVDPRPRWVTLFAWAFARLAAEVPRLRQSYMKFPRPFLYEHPESIATIAVERVWRGEEAVFFAKLDAPDKHPLESLDRHLGYYMQAPIETIDEHYLSLFVARLPGPIRRLCWSFGLNVSGDIRGRLFGTFGVSAYARLGAESLHPLSPVTSTLNFGEISPTGEVDVRWVYDHRVLDGSYVARSMGTLESILNEELPGEIEAGPSPGRRAA